MVEVAGLTIVPAARVLYAATHGLGAWVLPSIVRLGDPHLVQDDRQPSRYRHESDLVPSLRRNFLAPGLSGRSALHVHEREGGHVKQDAGVPVALF